METKLEQNLTFKRLKLALSLKTETFKGPHIVI